MITPTNYIMILFACKEIVICRAVRGVILFALLTVVSYWRGHLRSKYHPAESRISLHRNTTRRKANIAEKALAFASAFSWGG